jgi:hypothetical protein
LSDTGQMDELTLKGTDGGQLSDQRRQALQFYQGEPFGNEVDGRSQVVMRSVLEAVEWVLPALLRIFTASDKIAEFEPQGTDNPQLLQMREAAAEQATEYITHIFYRDNPGFIILHDWFKDALLQKLGWIKVYWDTQKITETNSFTGLSEAEYQALLADPNVEVVDKRSYPAPSPMGFNQDAPNV